MRRLAPFLNDWASCSIGVATNSKSDVHPARTCTGTPWYVRFMNNTLERTTMRRRESPGRTVVRP